MLSINFKLLINLFAYVSYLSSLYRWRKFSTTSCYIQHKLIQYDINDLAVVNNTDGDVNQLHYSRLLHFFEPVSISSTTSDSSNFNQLVYPSFKITFELKRCFRSKNIALALQCDESYIFGCNTAVLQFSKGLLLRVCSL